MIDFWLDNFMDLFSINNLNVFTPGIVKSENYIKMLNLVALVSIIIGISLVIKTKNPFYFAMTIVILSITILIKSNIKIDSFENLKDIPNSSNAFDSGVYLTRPLIYRKSQINNRMFVNNAFNLNSGDIIALKNDKLSTYVISSIESSANDNLPVLVLLNEIEDNYPERTRVLKVSDSSPNIVSPPDANESIQKAGNGNPDPQWIGEFPEFTLPNGNRHDWNLELSTGIPGTKNPYVYQGPPYGNLKARQSTINNPMGTINVTEYGKEPVMYGTANVQEPGVDKQMTDNLEVGVSMRPQDLLFHRGNSQNRFSPMPVDTLPNNQEAFAHFCYRNPTNLVNPKYASIFVNDPEKFKLVTKLARATGTENGGGGNK